MVAVPVGDPAAPYVGWTALAYVESGTWRVLEAASAGPVVAAALAEDMVVSDKAACASRPPSLAPVASVPRSCPLLRLTASCSPTPSGHHLQLPRQRQRHPLCEAVRAVGLCQPASWQLKVSSASAVARADPWQQPKPADLPCEDGRVSF